MPSLAVNLVADISLPLEAMRFVDEHEPEMFISAPLLDVAQAVSVARLSMLILLPDEACSEMFLTKFFVFAVTTAPDEVLMVMSLSGILSPWCISMLPPDEAKKLVTVGAAT